LIKFDNVYTITCSTKTLKYYVFYRNLEPAATVTCASHVADSHAVGRGISLSSFGDQG
jgi:hypothetical protein